MCVCVCVWGCGCVCESACVHRQESRGEGRESVLEYIRERQNGECVCVCVCVCVHTRTCVHVLYMFQGSGYNPFIRLWAGAGF